MTEPMLMTIKDIQVATQLGRTTVYELMREGELPYLKIGRSVRIRREVFEEWLQLHEAEVDVGLPNMRSSRRQA